MQLKGYLYIIISAVCSGLLPVFVKLGYQQGINLDTLLAMRFFIAAGILVGVVLVTGKIRYKVIKQRLPILGMQGLFYFGCAVCYMASASYLPAAIVSILFYLFPTIVIIIMTVFYRETLSPKRLISVVLTIIGCLLVIEIYKQNMNLDWWGIILGLGSAVCFALYSVRGSSLTQEFEPVIVTTCVMVVCSLSVMLTTESIGILSGELTLIQWLIGLGLSIVSTVIAAHCYLKGLSVLGASKSAIVSTIEPAFTIVTAWFFLGEKMTLAQLMGGVCIILGIIILKTEKEQGSLALKQTKTFKLY